MLTVRPLGTLKRVDLRTIWPVEPQFSRWLGENVGLLGEALGLDLEFIKNEAAVGPYSADVLVGVSGTEERVIIENQFGKTDHRHLGQLLTYVAGYDATHIIWICEVLSDEHRAALDWLNTNTSVNRNFYGVIVEALQIDESNPAINFRVAAAPNTFQKSSAGKVRDAEVSQDQQELNAVFDAVYERLKASGKFVRLLKPLGYLAYYVTERTHSKIDHSLAFSRDSFRAEVWFDFPVAALNAVLFQRVKARAAQIEAAAGEPIEWDFKDNRRRQGLRLSRSVDREHLADHIDEVAQWGADRLAALRTSIEAGMNDDLAAAEEAIETAEPGTGDENTL